MADTCSHPDDSFPTPAGHRRITGILRDLPDHLILGAQKSGTTQLDARLGTNPGIGDRTTKETRHLVQPHPRRIAYRQFFDLTYRRKRRERRLGHRIRNGDATPYYLFHPHVPRRAASMLPDVQCIVLLRDPALRAWSHYRHEVRLGHEKLDFADAINSEDQRTTAETRRLAEDPSATSMAHCHFSYVARGRYAEQLERWFQHVPRNRFLILFAEHFFEDEESILRQVEDFLGLPRTPPAESAVMRNRGDETPPDPEVIRKIRTELQSSNERLADLLDMNPPWPSA